MEVRFAGAHRFLDASLHFVDLRGRNMLLNAARWLVAFTAAEARAVHVHVLYATLGAVVKAGK